MDRDTQIVNHCFHDRPFDLSRARIPGPYFEGARRACGFMAENYLQLFGLAISVSGLVIGLGVI